MKSSRRALATAGQRPVLALTLLSIVLVVGALVPALTVAKPQRDRGAGDPQIAGQSYEDVAPLFAHDSQRRVQPEIVGGHRVSPGKFRFAAIVFIKTDFGTFQCGGSLIDELYIMTAAHCVEDFDGELLGPHRFTVGVGKTNINKLGRRNIRAVEAVFQHPDWNPETFENDVAVLKLKKFIASDVARPLPFVEADQNEFETTGTSLVVVGWGVTTEGGIPTSRLREVRVKVRSDASCVSDYEGQEDEFFPDVMLCAAEAGRDSCQGDSGGPLFAREIIGTKEKGNAKPIYRNTQVGIVSWGKGCARAQFPGVYTELSNPGINDFVRDIVGP